MSILLVLILSDSDGHFPRLWKGLLYLRAGIPTHSIRHHPLIHILPSLHLRNIELFPLIDYSSQENAARKHNNFYGLPVVSTFNMPERMKETDFLLSTHYVQCL